MTSLKRRRLRAIRFGRTTDDPEEIKAQLGLTKFGGRWQVEEPNTPQEFSTIDGEDYFITLSRAPDGCEEGRWVAELHPSRPSVSKRKGWPRFYFDAHRAKTEIEAWLVFNGQLPQPEEENEQNEIQDSERNSGDHACMGSRAA